MRIYAIGLITPFVLSGCGGDSASDDNASASVAANVTNSSACFNTELHKIGTEVIATYSKSGGTGAINITDHTKLTGPVTYNGQNDVIAIEEVGENNTTYVVFDDSNKSVTTLGQIENGTETRYLPSGILLEYELNINETRTYPTISVTENGVHMETMDMAFTFLMTESVTVPAGTFETCKFNLTIKGAKPDGSSYTAEFIQHFGADNGIMIYDTWTVTSDNGPSFSGTESLVSATINGNAI